MVNLPGQLVTEAAQAKNLSVQYAVCDFPTMVLQVMVPVMVSVRVPVIWTG